MNGITELAKLFKDRENAPSYSPMFGQIISLPSLKIQVGGNIILTRGMVKFTFDVEETDADGNYIYLNEEAVLLPYSDGQKFICIGVTV